MPHPAMIPPSLADAMLALAHATHRRQPPRLVLLALTEARFAHGLTCPHCSSRRIQRWGHHRQRQRYRCSRCRRTFTAFTGTPLARTRHPDKWPALARCLLAGCSVRSTARRLKVAPTTAFRWRHRLLAALHRQAPRRLNGIVELTETIFHCSAKGSRTLRRPARRRSLPHPWRIPESERVWVLLARDRLGEAGAAALADRSPAAVRSALRPLLGREVVLCTDRPRPYRSLCQQEGIRHGGAPWTGDRRADRLHHVRNARLLLARLYAWLRRFHGVATRYLPRYLSWFVWLGRIRRPSDLLLVCMEPGHP